ncbi:MULTISPECIES: MarR family winged helix-turn-helix transcriptional regulator [Pseudoalteromonas]|uniref:MarR family winged helix-turn-helix transcriptional regulator n=1 Tax=Pseudoalteromonas TaxID=53246 RepID=UPI0015829762|nr:MULTISPECIES: MarR family winged helix-turn-helix transcriptional regulator [Pseudoalteromonas]MDI4654041.1 MarR family winged helix-turn-helix transcriptional regulator [Pseudoalteromonas shioyasakiensis]NUJ40269.1 winged helix-turn-helix transcriptional regulator [Pseudoalteromonas sp. 0303]
MTTDNQTTLDLKQFLPYSLTNIAMQMSEQFSELYQQQFDLTVPQWRIIANLAQYGERTAKELCDMAQMDKSTVSRAVKSLLTRNLIIAKENPEDKRANLLSLSVEGNRLHEQIVPLANEWQAGLVSDLDSQELKQFMNTLSKLSNHLNKSV